MLLEEIAARCRVAARPNTSAQQALRSEIYLAIVGMILRLWSRAMILPLWAGHNDARKFTPCRMIFLPWSCRCWHQNHDPKVTPARPKIRSPLLAAFAISLNLATYRLWDLYVSYVLIAVFLWLLLSLNLAPTWLCDLYISYALSAVDPLDLSRLLWSCVHDLDASYLVATVFLPY